MKPEPFIDRIEVERVLRAAQSSRAKFLVHKSEATANTVRQRGFRALLAAGRALFVGHGAQKAVRV